MTPIETLAVALLALAAFGFWMWQLYRLQKVLADPEHPEHDMAKEAIADQHRDPFDRWRFP